MPKEKIVGDSFSPAFGTPEEPTGRSVAVVGWDRETGHVQLVTKCESMIGGRFVPEEDEGVHYTDGFYVTLDRRGINDLIRHLRRARDQAFGRDE